MIKEKERIKQYENKIKEIDKQIEEMLGEKKEKREEKIDIEEPEKKLSFFEKLALKRMIKKVKKAKQEKDEEKQKDKLILAIMTTQEIFEIYDDETGEIVTTQLLLTKEIEQLQTLLDNILKELEKIL